VIDDKRSEAVVDIIIPVFNACEFTRQCLESIFRNVAIPTRVLIIDNASSDATCAIVEGLRTQCPGNVELSLISNAENRGWIGGVNQGIELSRAPYVVISNNDVLVYPHAIEEMIAIAESDPRIGLVNPNSNEFGALSDSADQPPSQPMTEDNYRQFRGRWVERCAVIGFFALVKREVIQKIGGLDPVYSPGYSEDDDYSERARTEGFLCRALGAYVHHFGSKTFQSESKKALKKRNEAILEKRWGVPRREAVLVGWNIASDPECVDRFCEKLKERFRKKTGYIYLFVPKSKKSLFAMKHDYFRIKTYPTLGLGQITFFLWCLLRPRHKKVVVLSSEEVSMRERNSVK
jgi:GT2 family glycosyltransferase